MTFPFDGCTVEGCGRPAKARGLCRSHYDRERLAGAFDKTHKPKCDGCGTQLRWDATYCGFCAYELAQVAA